MEDRSTEGKPKRPQLLLAVGAVAVLAALAAFAAATLLPEPKPTVESPASAEAPQGSREATREAASTIESEAQYVAGQLRTANAGWTETVTEVRITTLLRRPVIEVATGIPGEDAVSADALSQQIGDFALGLTTPSGLPPTYRIHVLSADGDLLGTAARTDERWRLDTPPVPADAASLKSWLDAVYRTDVATPESWVCHVLDVLGSSADRDGYVVVRTDLDPEHEGDLADAQKILWAVNSSGATFAPGIKITFADPEFEWSGVMDGQDIFGQR